MSKGRGAKRRRSLQTSRKVYKFLWLINTMITESKQILEELKTIKSELDYIRENMVDKDMFLTLDEKQLLEDSYKNEKEGKLVSSKSLRKHLGL